MPLVNMQDMLAHAYRNKYAVGAFDLVSLDFLEAIVQGAERRRAPVILSLAESHFEHFDFELAMAATVAAARRAHVPVAIHLDHGHSLDSAVRGINLGCNGVMVDASTQPFAGNVSTTHAVVAMAQACGVPVEGELGYVAGVEGEDAEKHPGEVVYTAPEEAHAYVEQTGVDFLAVSIGTVHGRMRGAPRLDFERLARINETLGIPLVIHGGTGLSDDQYRRLIENGVAKINYYTALADAAAARIRENAARDTGTGYTGLVKDVRVAIQAEVERMIGLFGSNGRAEACLQAARPWREVEHCIVYNADKNLRDDELEQMLASGRACLSTIPGVQRVFTGRALRGDANYRYCWLVRFASSTVVASYRDHPAHVGFADKQFRPHAADRMSIDFESVE
jgi:fructose-bisphosphate aldolase class II